MGAIQQVLLGYGSAATAGIVASLLHFDGTGSTFTDATGKTCTAYGSATQSATQSVFGGKSLDLTGGAGRVEIASSTDFDFGTGPFLIEWREYRTSNTDYQNAFSRGYNVAGGLLLQTLTVSGAPRTLYFMNGSGVARAVMNCPGTALNTWVAWAIQRDAGGGLRCFHDGVQTASTVANADTTLSLGLSAPFVIGADNASLYWHRGYIDEFRVQKGVAPYTVAGYTPAASAFTYP